MRVEYVDHGDRKRIEITLAAGKGTQLLPIGQARQLANRIFEVLPGNGACDPWEGLSREEREAEIAKLEAARFESPISLWFELSYARFLTVPRLVLESMPIEWQRQMAALLQAMDDTFDWRPKEGRYWVQLKDGQGRFTEAPLQDYRRGRIEHLRWPAESSGRGVADEP